MSKRIILIVMALAVVSAACEPVADNATAPTTVRDPGATTTPGTHASCVASNAEWARGQRARDELLEKARASAQAGTARFLVRGQPVTLEYLATRLNLELDRDRIVRAVTCG